MTAVCRFIADNTVPGGRYFVPGCMGGAMARDGQEYAYCYCDRRKARADLFQRVEQLERDYKALKQKMEPSP